MTENTAPKTPTQPPEITYQEVGDYLIPNIGIPEDEDSLPALTYWGMMRLNYLKNHRRVLYTPMKLSGELFIHCHAIEEQAKDMMELLMKQLTEAHPEINEELKATNQLKWVGLMNALKSQAEEIVKTDLIYS